MERRRAASMKVVLWGPFVWALVVALLMQVLGRAVVASNRLGVNPFPGMIMWQVDLGEVG